MSGVASRRIPTDVLLIGGWTLLAILVVSIPVVRGSAVRIVVAGSFLLFAPGYALVAALFVHTGKLSLLERLVFSVGASFAAVILVGIVLAETPALGISLETVLASQSLVVVVFLTIAMYRRRAFAPDERTTPGSDVITFLRAAWYGRAAVGGGSRVLQVAIVLAVVATVGATVYVVATPLPSERYTEFYVQGHDGAIESIPETVGPDEDIELLIGVANHEHRTVEYGLQVQIRTEGDTAEIATTDSWRLGHEEAREEVLTLEPADQGAVAVEFLLFLELPPGEVVDAETAYRQVSVTVTVEPGD